ncbi:MAG: Na+/H+ antiporter subunit E [Candidatus Eisenbacteria bacterium]
MKRRLLDLVIIFALWMLLTWSLDVQSVIAGAVIAILFAFLLSGLLPQRVERLLSPVRWFWAIMHLISLSFWIVVANFDVLYRVVHPNMPIRPGIVKIKTTLKSDEGKAFLANSITLTPGTLTVDIIDDWLYVHWINVHESLEDTEAMTRDIAGRFEVTLRRVFD